MTKTKHDGIIITCKCLINSIRKYRCAYVIRKSLVNCMKSIWDRFVIPSKKAQVWAQMTKKGYLCLETIYEPSARKWTWKKLFSKEINFHFDFEHNLFTSIFLHHPNPNYPNWFHGNIFASIYETIQIVFLLFVAQSSCMSHKFLCPAMKTKQYQVRFLMFIFCAEFGGCRSRYMRTFASKTSSVFISIVIR